MKLPTAVAALLCSVSPLAAQEFTGGELGFEYNQSFDDSDVDGTSYFAGAEMAINREFSFGVDLADIDGADVSTQATFHGIYHLSDAASVGAFYSYKDEDAATYGIEGGIEIWGGDVSGYVGRISVDDESAFIIGFDSSNPIADSNFSLFSDFDLVSDDEVAITTNEIGVEYNIPQGADIYALYGQASAFADGGSGSTDYFGVGARIRFGAERGTTFEAR